MSYVFETSKGERIQGLKVHFENMRLRSAVEVVIADEKQIIYRAVRAGLNHH